MKFIKTLTIYVLAFMLLLNSIVPTAVFADGEEDDDYTKYKIFKFSNELSDDTFIEFSYNGDSKYATDADVFAIGSIGAQLNNWDDPKAVADFLDDKEKSSGFLLENAPDTYDRITTESGRPAISIAQLKNRDLAVDEEEWVNLSFNVYNSAGELIAENKYISELDEKYVTTQNFESYTGRVNSAINEVPEPASVFEQIITAFFLTIGDGMMWAIGAVAGQNISLDALFFNQYKNTNIDLFNYPNGSPYNAYENPIIRQNNIKGNISDVYQTFTVIAVATFLASLLYIGIKILLSDTGRGKARYKDYLMAWLKGVAILFIFPIVMRFTIEANIAFVEEIHKVSYQVINNSDMPQVQSIPFGGIDAAIHFGGTELRDESQLDYMAKLRLDASRTGKLAYAICWLVLIIELIKFIFFYFKRLLTIIFLFTVFPLVTMTYAIDKAGDGKSQAFDHWFKEFVLNVFLQTFHALNYAIIMAIIGSINASGVANYILILVAVTYIAKGEGILRGIFGQTGGVGTVQNATESLFKAAAISKAAKTVTSGMKNASRRITKLNDRRRNVADRRYRYEENRLRELNDDLTAQNPDLPAIEAYMPASRSLTNAITAEINSFTQLGASPEQIDDAIRSMRGHKNDPLFKRRLMEMGVSESEVNDLMEQQEILENIEKNINVKNNLELLINRKRTSVRGEKLLEAYGLSEQKIRSMYSSFDQNVAKMKRMSDISGRRTKGRSTYKGVARGVESVTVSKRSNSLGTGSSETGGSGVAVSGKIVGGAARKDKQYKLTSVEELRKKRLERQGKKETDETERNTRDTRQPANNATRGKKNQRKIAMKRRQDEVRKMTFKALDANGKPVDVNRLNSYKALAYSATLINSADSTQDEKISAMKAFDELAFEMERQQGGAMDSGVEALRREIHLDEETQKKIDIARKIGRNENKEQRFIAEYIGVGLSGSDAERLRAETQRVSTEAMRAKLEGEETGAKISNVARRNYQIMAKSVAVLNDENATLEQKVEADRVFKKLALEFDDGDKGVTALQSEIGLDQSTRRLIDEIGNMVVAYSTDSKLDIKWHSEVERVSSAAINAKLKEEGEDISEARRIKYRILASDIEILNSGETSVYEKLTARKEINEVSAILGVDDAGVRLIDRELSTTDTILRAIANVDRTAEEYRRAGFTGDAEQVAIAAEVFGTGQGTLDELWDAYRVCSESGVDVVKSDPIEERAFSLAIDTINNIEELDSRDQAMVDDAIRVIQRHLSDGGVYAMKLNELKYNPRTLVIGQMPETKKMKREKSEEAEKIESELRERREAQEKAEKEFKKTTYADPIKNLQKERKKILLDTGKLVWDTTKEAVIDSAAVVGAATALSAFTAVDTKQEPEKIIASGALGGEMGRKSAETITYYGEETYYSVRDGARTIRDRLDKDRDGRDPIKLNKK